MGRGVTQAVAHELQPATARIGRERDRTLEDRSGRARYRVYPQDDGGAWQGPTDEAWATRILRGARPPRASTGMPHEPIVPHG